MDSQTTQPKRPRRLRRLAVSVSFFLLALLAGLSLTLWALRLPLATRAVRHALDAHGLSDMSFRLVRLSAGCVVAEDLALGAPEKVLAVDRAEILFTYPDVLRGRIDRVRVRGVRTPAVIDCSRAWLPLQVRLASLSPPDAARGTKASRRKKRVSVGEVSVYDVQVPVRLAGGDEVVVLRGDASVVSEPEGRPADALQERYRLWAKVSDAGDVQGTVTGNVTPETGALTLAADVKVKSVEGVLERVRLVAPDQVAGLAAFPTNCAFALRGSLALSNWTNAGTFEVTAELGRGSAFALAKSDGLIRFQTVRVEASGTPQDVQCRLSAGIAGFRIGGRVQVSQEEGRLLSMRGTARIRQTSTNRVVRATLDSDLPGKSIAQALPNILPLLPRLLTEGGTLHAEAELAQAFNGPWQGDVRYTAEARRSALTLPAGRVDAGRVAISGTLRVCDTLPGELRTAIRLEDGYFFRPGVSVRGGGQLSLTAQPPYRSAAGTFEGSVSETVALAKSGVNLPDTGVRFGGTASVAGLVSNPVWDVSLQVPEFGLASLAAAPSWRATAGAAARIRYGGTQLALDGDAWLRDAVVALVTSGKVGRVEAGLERLTARIGVADARPSDLSNALVRVAIEARNGWSRAGERMTLEGAEASVPFTWSVARGVRFGEEPRLSWQRLESAGVRIVPDALALRAEGGCVEAAFGVKVEGSRFGATATARVPLSDPLGCVIDVRLPETELAADDALAAVVRRMDKELAVTARVAAEGRVRFLGRQPHVLGRIRVAGGEVARGGVEVSGLSVDIPFEGGLGFRTIERPSVTFTSAKAGNVRLDKGKIEFQVTPQEVFVDRMEVGWCKGSLNAYSVHLDPKNPKADVIVYADRIDLGEALMMVVPFKGRIEGVLYGRFPVGIDHGRVKLSTGFLYSLPGQGGKLRLDDPAPMVSLLSRAGIQGEVQQPLSRALSDMDFSAVRMELEPKAEGDAVFRIKLDGKSNYKEWPAPVALNLNLHGPLEELLNLGLDMSRK